MKFSQHLLITDLYKKVRIYIKPYKKSQDFAVFHIKKVRIHIKKVRIRPLKSPKIRLYKQPTNSRQIYNKTNSARQIFLRFFWLDRIRESNRNRGVCTCLCVSTAHRPLTPCFALLYALKRRKATSF